MSPSLKKYQSQRDFRGTSEPRGRVKKTQQSRFVVQKHQATQLHYDFRLELDGVLKSWAVPKPPPRRAGLKRLAMPTEDHPIDYLNFKGVIPKGHYGAGWVKIWDKGKFELLEKNLKTRKGKSLKFKLHGQKLKGDYVLYQFRDKDWLLYKIKSKKRESKTLM